MKKLQGMLLLMSAMFSIAALGETVKSCIIKQDKMPVRGLALKPDCRLQVAYDFQPGMNVLLCLSNTLKNAGKITWPYQGKQHTADLPVILSKTGNDPSVMIDASGEFSVQNDQKKQLVISCQFGRGVSRAGVSDVLKTSPRLALAKVCVKDDVIV